MSEVTQYEGILTYVDAAGNETEMYPEVKTDKSLTVSGKPADAKAVGDKITEAMKNAGGKVITLTQEEYDALPEEEKKNGIYVVPGGEDLTAKNLFYDGSETGLGNNVQDAVDNVNKKVEEQNKNFDNLAIEPDYENKVDLLPYTSTTNCYTVTTRGFLWVNTGLLASGTRLSIFDNSGKVNGLVSEQFGSNSLYIAQALANQVEMATIPVSVGMQLYVTGGNAGYVWFIPYK